MLWFVVAGATAVNVCLCQSAFAEDASSSEEYIIIEPDHPVEALSDDDINLPPSTKPKPVCNYGPKRVPKPKGKAMRRAKALGLGTRHAASRLISGAPERRWVNAVRGRVSKRLIMPVRKAKLGRGFGLTRTENSHIPHEGIDIKAARGATVRAAADGIVAYSDNGLCGYGNVVLIIHRNGWVTLYAHHDRNLVQAGQFVNRGDRIGLVGATGKAHGAHLHFELRVKGKPQDPVPKIVGLQKKKIDTSLRKRSSAIPAPSQFNPLELDTSIFVRLT